MFLPQDSGAVESAQLDAYVQAVASALAEGSVCVSALDLHVIRIVVHTTLDLLDDVDRFHRPNDLRCDCPLCAVGTKAGHEAANAAKGTSSDRP